MIIFFNEAKFSLAWRKKSIIHCTKDRESNNSSDQISLLVQLNACKDNFVKYRQQECKLYLHHSDTVYFRIYNFFLCSCKLSSLLRHIANHNKVFVTTYFKAYCIKRCTISALVWWTLVIVICVVYKGIAESKTGVGDEDVRNTAVNLVMVSQGPTCTLFKLNISCTIILFEVKMCFTLLSLTTILITFWWPLFDCQHSTVYF